MLSNTAAVRCEVYITTHQFGPVSTRIRIANIQEAKLVFRLWAAKCFGHVSKYSLVVTSRDWSSGPNDYRPLFLEVGPSKDIPGIKGGVIVNPNLDLATPNWDPEGFSDRESLSKAWFTYMKCSR